MIYEEQKNQENGRPMGFLRSLISAYSAVPGHGLTGVNGKIVGALMAVNSIADAVPLIHGPIGCAFQRKINPFRPYLPFYETPCTNMKDIEVVYGGEDKLETGIKESYKKYHPNLIVVISTCASDLIGSDFRSVIGEIREDVGCAVVYTTGDSVGKRMAVGHQDTLYSITDQLLCNNVEGTEKIDGAVNLITYPIHGAGRGVIVVVDLLKNLGLYDSDLDMIIYDVLGDVVCGGFGIPLRRGLADDAFIVTSADYLSIYAANNICNGISRFAGGGGSPLGGIVYNVRGAIDDPLLVDNFAQSIGTNVIGAIPSDPTIMENEIYARTAIEHKSASKIADIFRDMAMRIYENKETVSPTPLPKEGLSKLAIRIRQKIRDEYLKG